MTASHASRIGLLALSLGAVLISLSPICVRLSETGPVATGAYRLAFALPALMLWLAIESRSALPGRRPRTLRDFLWLALAGLFFAGDLAAWNWSVMLTSVANSTLFANTAPIWVTLGAWLLLKERIRPGFVVGLGLALSGAALLVGLSLSASRGQVVGDLLGLLTGLFYGSYQIALKRLRNRFSTATIMFWSALPALVLLVALALASEERLFALSLAGWGVLLFLALVVHAGGQSLIGYAFAHLPASFSSVALLAQPVLAALWGFLALGEGLSAVQGAGGFVVLAGIALAHRYSARPEPVP